MCKGSEKSKNIIFSVQQEMFKIFQISHFKIVAVPVKLREEI